MAQSSRPRTIPRHPPDGGTELLPGAGEILLDAGAWKVYALVAHDCRYHVVALEWSGLVRVWSSPA